MVLERKTTMGYEINYPKEDYPDGAPTFKNYKGVITLGTVVASNSIEDNRFKTIEVLEYMVGKDRLRDVITQVTVTDRTI